MELCYKMRFLRGNKTLFAFCWRMGEFENLNPVQTFLRVDPTATTDNRPTPIELAVSGNHNEVLKILLEYTEMPNKLKLPHLAKLMNADDEEAKAEFKKMLSTMPLDLVRVPHKSEI